MFRSPQVNLYTRDLSRSLAFYLRLGFGETFRYPKHGPPEHIELVLDGFTLGIASLETTIANHGLSPDVDGQGMEIVLWVDDTDRAVADLTADGAPLLSAPHDWLTDLRLAWIADPDDNPIQIVSKRRSEDRP